jgi:hypothetical protein
MDNRKRRRIVKDQKPCPTCGLTIKLDFDFSSEGVTSRKGNLRTFRTTGTPLDTTGWQTVIVDCFFVKPIDPDGEMIDFSSRVARGAENAARRCPALDHRVNVGLR